MCKSIVGSVDGNVVKQLVQRVLVSKISNVIIVGP